MIRNLLKSLLKPSAYPEETSRVEMLQTHVSWLFLTDLYVYKVKKPVDFGFLNFSTIDRRRFYCNEEVRCNRRLCPDIYLGVVELNRDSNGVRFEGHGEVIDYAVKMKRLPAEGMLENMIRKGEATTEDIEKVAAVIAEFHKNAAVTPEIASYGESEKILANWKENFEAARQFNGLTISAIETALIQKWVLSFIEQHTKLFQQRAREGFVRECDGDIHLQNICIRNGNIHIFDCIEFNERYRNCDTAADIAFLIMDLEFHGCRQFADTALGTYLEHSGDRGAVPLINFYKTYRAFVRGKVESLCAISKDTPEADRELSKQRAKLYFRLVRGYIERSRLKTAIFITCGLMGTGKSTLASQLALELGIQVFSSDRTRKELAGLPPEQKTGDAFKNGLYSQKNTEKTYARLVELASAELDQQHSVIIDACFPSRKIRALFSQLAQTYTTCDFVILHLNCSEPEIRRRLSERDALDYSISDGRIELLKDQQDIFEAPDASEGLVISIDTSRYSEPPTDYIYERLNHEQIIRP